MMDPKFGKPARASPYVPGRIDLDQMPETPTRSAHHRRAHSETFFRFPDLDDMLVDSVFGDLVLPEEPPPPLAQPHKGQGSKAAPQHLRSLSVDADFFDGLNLDEAPPVAAEAGPRPRHRHSNSMDGYSSATSIEVDDYAKKAMADDKLAELALIDPKRAKRILANRQSAARSKERKTRYTSELERKVQTLQTEATTLSAQITLLQDSAKREQNIDINAHDVNTGANRDQDSMTLVDIAWRDTTGLTAENKELKLKLQAMEQQAHLRDALNEALRNELHWLKVTAGQNPIVNGNNRGSPSQFPPQPRTSHYFGNDQAQQR